MDEASAVGTPAEETYGIAPEVYRRRWAILFVLCISLVMVVTAVGSLNVALPTIQRSLDTSGTQLQWIVDAYALVFAGLLLPAGALGDRFGRRGALQIGLLIFGGASLFASQAGGAGALIAMRTFMGAGAALIMPATLSIIVNCFPFHERPRAVSVWSAFAGLGAVLGPVASGLLLRHFWWGSVFFVNIPLVILLLGLSLWIVPTSKDPHGHSLDPIGALLSVVSLVSLVFAVIEGPDKGWLSVQTIASFLVAIVAGVAFVRYELAAHTPMLDPRLFRLRGFAAGAAAVTAAFFCLFGLFFMLTQYFQYVKGYDTLKTGLATLPSAVTLMVVAPQGFKIVGRIGIKRMYCIGYAFVVTGFTLLAFATVSTPYPVVALALVCNGAGIALLMPTASQHIVGSLPLSKAGVGSAMNDVTREVGGALGIAVAGSVLSTVYRSHAHFANLITDPGARNLANDSIGKAVGVADQSLASKSIGADVYHAIRAEASHAFSSGTRVAFLALVAISCAAAVLIIRFIPDHLPQRQVADRKAVDGAG